MNYKNIIKSNLKREKKIEEMKETGTTILSSVVGFVKEKKETVNKIYNNKKDDFSKRNIYNYAICGVDGFILKLNPSDKNPILITKNVLNESDMVISVESILTGYDITNKEKYIDVVFDVLKLHFSNEPQLTVLSKDEGFLLYINEEVEDEEDEEVEVEEVPVEVVEDSIIINSVKEETNVEDK